MIRNKSGINCFLLILLTSLCVLFNSIHSFTISQGLTHYEQNSTLTYSELIAAYHHLDSLHQEAELITIGKSDNGKPLHVFLINKRKHPSQHLGDKSQVHLFINNGIHPGEPDGIDASLNFAEQLLQQKTTLPDHLSIAIIPVYNVDGMLERSCCSRANQNGPMEYGFRGNAKNLDLNRDFVKADSRNAQSFAVWFHRFQPDLFIDTHVSNGADYQYTMTMLFTQLDKLKLNRSFCEKSFIPFLYATMEAKKFPMVPYVNTKEETPESGILDFIESPRFATGYAALFGVIGITTETHMWKAYPQRVKSTMAFLDAVIDFISKNKDACLNLQNSFRKTNKKPIVHSFNYVNDTLTKRPLKFKGFESYTVVSKVTGEHQLQYNRKKPFEKNVDYYSRCYATDSVSIPEAYIIPQAWQEVIKRLLLNNVEITLIKQDEEKEVIAYYIENFSTRSTPYESHYLHYSTQTREQKTKVKLYEGDVVVKTNQDNWRYIVEMLEPRSEDSFFAWGFFDGILSQKEWFSDYIFNAHAEKMLENDAALKAEFDEKVSKKELVSAFDKLYFLYKKSDFFEKSYKRYPVYKIANN